ncbi:MAG TPA: NTP transferase domain-containing protein, partial [Polyangia bacterium]|nr:NTP transferase domain-containing protein [Polyangia bacterium]
MGGGTAAIIAGGPARRLGGAVKPLLEVGGRAVADRQLAVLRPLDARVFAVANDPAPWRARGVEVVADRVAGAGPLAGLGAALAAAGEAEAV